MLAFQVCTNTPGFFGLFQVVAKTLVHSPLGTHAFAINKIAVNNASRMTFLFVVLRTKHRPLCMLTTPSAPRVDFLIEIKHCVSTVVVE
jgi:hypothetical protein